MTLHALATQSCVNQLRLGVVTEPEAQRTVNQGGCGLALSPLLSPNRSLEIQITPPEGGYDTANNPDLYQDAPVSFDNASIILGIEGATSHEDLRTSPKPGRMVAGELWERREHYRDSIVARLKESGDRTHWQALDDCHTEPTYCRCNACGRTQVFLNRCDLYYCPLCQPNLERRRTEAVSWWFAQVRQPKHLILTVTNTNGINKGMVQEMRSWFSKLRRNKVARGWRGGFYSIQCTNKGRGWHLHIHAVISADWIDQTQVSKVWSKINGGYGNNVKLCDARRRDARHDVIRYIAKGSSMARWSGAQIAEFLAAFDGVRAFGVFGNLFAKRAAWTKFKEAMFYGKPQCECGCEEFRYYDRLSWQAFQHGLSGVRTRPP